VFEVNQGSAPRVITQLKDAHQNTSEQERPVHSSISVLQPISESGRNLFCEPFTSIDWRESKIPIYPPRTTSLLQWQSDCDRPCVVSYLLRTRLGTGLIEFGHKKKGLDHCSHKAQQNYRKPTCHKDDAEYRS